MSGHVATTRSYVAIFGALMALTALTVGVAFVDLAMFSFAAAMAIAVLKATLVVLFFMHVKYSSGLTKLIIVTGLFFLGVLFALTLSDYLTREWQTAQPSQAVGRRQ